MALLLARPPVKYLNVRDAAVRVLLKVLIDGQSCSKALPEVAIQVAEKERALLQEFCYGVLRWHEKLQSLQRALMQKDLRRKDQDIAILIQLGLYQLVEMSIPDHAVLQETVRVTGLRRKNWAKGVTNAVLRRFQREKQQLLDTATQSSPVKYSHPKWMIGQFTSDWPEHWQQICDDGNKRPPMTLRVNQKQIDRIRYLALLEERGMPGEAHPSAESAIVLSQPVDVQILPGFSEGHVSIQDAGAQLAATLLNPNRGARVLDACAAPGGKTCHLLESVERLDLTALDSDPVRCERINENLQRLNLKATVLCADAADTQSWWKGEQFDAILLDVPCSALGVIRRHPDIKSLRTEQDLVGLMEQQQRILESVWPLLKVGGRLLYATCSLAKGENSGQIVRFVSSQNDANSIKIDADWGTADVHGRQILTGQQNMDGFYYALLEKTA